MANLPEQQWMIEVNSQETGPFSLDQVRGLLKEHQILPSFRVKKRSQPNTAWITVAELMKQAESFTPPPRPNTQKGEVTRITIVRPGLKNDPTENLFEALQSHKEKTTSIQRPTSASSRSTYGAHQPIETKIRPAWASPIVLLLVGTSFALGFMLWSAYEIVQLSQKSEQKSPSIKAQNTEEKAAPAYVPTIRSDDARPSTSTTRVQKTLPSSADPSGRIQIITERPSRSVTRDENEDRIDENSLSEKPNAVGSGRAAPNSKTDQDRDRDQEARRDDPYDYDANEEYPIEETNEVYVGDEIDPETPIQE